MLIMLEIRKWFSQQNGDDHSELMCAFVKKKCLNKMGAIDIEALMLSLSLSVQ